MKPKILLILLLLLLHSSAGLAEEQKDSAFANLYRKYFELYADSNETVFYMASEKMKEYYLEHNLKDSYYKVCLNEILYDTEHGKTYRAIKKCNSILNDVEKDKDKHYEIVYSALGNIYDMRGNYRMAMKYFNEAIKACHPTDSAALAAIYPRIAALQAHREPQKAWEANERFGKLIADSTSDYKIYVVLKGEIAFYLKDKKRFEEAYRQYQDVSRKRPLLDAYGKDMMTMVNATFSGDYHTALNILNHESIDFDLLDRCDMRIQIYEMMGNFEKASQEVAKRRDIRDSLNCDMLFESINEINSEMGMNKIREEARQKEAAASKRQIILLIVAIVLLIAALGLVISRNLMRLRMQKQLLKKNKELEIALLHAEESDRMKDSFIQHVSHEIRTPLNIITGYAQVVTNPDYHLSNKERDHILGDISKNTKEITYIVNELLEVAEEESKQHYQKDDCIRINTFCRRMMTQAEKENNGRLEMKFSTELPDNFSIHSNRRAMEKILEQLLSNAMKFTEEGYVALKVEASPDHDVVRFVIEDTGIGIADKHHEKVFERFYKVDAFKQGFGLGLTISRKMAILLGGGISIDNEYTGGARFFFILPV